MNLESNDCFTFNLSPASTNYTICQLDEQRNPDQSIIFKIECQESTSIIDIDCESMEYDDIMQQTKQQKEQRMCKQIMDWFSQKNVLYGNPEDIWKNHNTQLHRKVSEVILQESDSDVIRSSSSLLQRRLRKSIKIQL